MKGTFESEADNLLVFCLVVDYPAAEPVLLLLELLLQLADVLLLLCHSEA